MEFPIYLLRGNKIKTILFTILQSLQPVLEFFFYFTMYEGTMFCTYVYYATYYVYVLKTYYVLRDSFYYFTFVQFLLRWYFTILFLQPVLEFLVCLYVLQLLQLQLQHRSQQLNFLISSCIWQ